MLHYGLNRIQGMVLLIVLIFLQISFMLGLYLMQDSFISQKLSQFIWKKTNMLITAEYVLQQIEQDILRRNTGCHIHVLNSHELMNKPLEWWQSKACPGIYNGYPYYYIFEKLIEDPCADIGQNIPYQTALYFRITLLLIDLQNNVREILQSTIIKPDNANQQCKGRYYSKLPGRQSWRSF